MTVGGSLDGGNGFGVGMGSGSGSGSTRSSTSSRGAAASFQATPGSSDTAAVMGSGGDCGDQLCTNNPGSISFASAAEPEQQGRWRFCLLQPQPGFTAALCVEQEADGLEQPDELWQPPSFGMWQTVPLLQKQTSDSSTCLLAVS